VTPYIDGELSAAERDLVAAHVRVCAPCHSRVAAEQAVRTLIHARKSTLSAIHAPESLRAKCNDAARLDSLRAADVAVPASPMSVSAPSAPSAPSTLSPTGASTRPRVDPRFSGATAVPWRTRLAPLALAASLVLVVGGAFVYQVTDASARVMAAELTADHVKCFAMNRMLDTHDLPTTVESSMFSGFGWNMHLPEEPSRAGLELVGARPCLYGEGKIAHIMYRHDGRPVSLFMLPNASRSRELIQVLGHQAAIWCVGNRTFVLISREPKRDVEQMASFVQASLR
jgi:anti-sigma factor RsiW